MADQAEFRDRLTRFYQHYAPDKVATVEAALETYKGREEQMWKALERKYGPENAVPGSEKYTHDAAPGAAPAGPTPPVPTLNFNPNRPRLVRFYEKYATDKLNAVDATLEKYKGKEDLMFLALVKKYGPEPEAENGPGPGPTASGGGGGLTKDATLSVVPTEGAPSAGENNEYRPRMVRFYEKYAPDKVASVDAALAKYKGKEEAMFSALVTKYGPEPEAPSSSAASPAAPATAAAEKAPTPAPTPEKAPAPAESKPAAASPHEDNPYKPRLIRFLEARAPDKINSADGMLTKYKGKEEEMFAALAKKMGAEPEDPAAASPQETIPAETATPAPTEAAVEEKKEVPEPEAKKSEDAPPAPAESKPEEAAPAPAAEEKKPDETTPPTETKETTKPVEEEKPEEKKAEEKKAEPEAKEEKKVEEKKEEPKKEEVKKEEPPKEGPKKEEPVKEEPKKEDVKDKPESKAPAESPRAKTVSVAGEVKEVAAPSPRARTPPPVPEDDKMSDSTITTDGGADGEKKKGPFNIKSWLVHEQGIASYAIPKLLTLYGTGPQKESYAGSMIMLLRIIGDDQLFDLTASISINPAEGETNTEGQLTFPAEWPKGTRDKIDDLAFEHLNEHRALFLKGFEAGCVVREEEDDARAVIREVFVQGRNQISYTQLVLSEAINLIQPIESDTRTTLVNDERLRFQGLCTWFRTKRHEIHLEQDDPLEQMQEAERKMERFRQTQAQADLKAERSYIHNNKKTLSASTEKWKRMASESVLSSGAVEGSVGGVPAPTPNHFSPGSSSRGFSPSAGRRRESFDPIARASHSKIFGTQPSTPSRSASYQSAIQQPGPSILRSQSTRSTSVATSNATSSKYIDRRSGSPTHSTASTKHSTLSSRRDATLNALKEKPLKSQRAKKVAAPGCFSQLKIISADAARESVSAKSSGVGMDRERFTFT